MPFLGQDWRSPGEQWVRTAGGWERLHLWRLKLFENLSENLLERILKLTDGEDLLIQKDLKTSQPHITITHRPSRENKMQISLAEGLTRLDMSGAAKDIRRFNYVCKLLEFLVTHKLSTVSGAAQKVIFDILEEVINQVMKTKNNVSTVHRLLRELRFSLDRGYYDHIGSSSLWHKHLTAADRMQNMVNDVELNKRADDGRVTMSDLPDDCLREILLRLSNHRDLISTGLTDYRTLQLSQENHFWRDLCLFHFDCEQLKTVVRKGETLDSLGWRTLHHRLFKRYGLRDVFAEMLSLCQGCHTIYWENHGHHCLVEDRKPQSVPVSPAMFVELFNM